MAAYSELSVTATALKPPGIFVSLSPCEFQTWSVVVVEGEARKARLAEIAVGLRLGQQDAVGHQFDVGVPPRLIRKADLVADGLAERLVQFLGDPLADCPGRQPAGLGMADEPVRASPDVETDLRQLGGLARAGLAGDDDHLVFADGGAQLVAHRADGQIGIGDRHPANATNAR